MHLWAQLTQDHDMIFFKFMAIDKCYVKKIYAYLCFNLIFIKVKVTRSRSRSLYILVGLSIVGKRNAFGGPVSESVYNTT